MRAENATFYGNKQYANGGKGGAIHSVGDPTQIFAGGPTNNGGDMQTVALRADVSNVALDATTSDGADARGVARGVDLVGLANGGTSDLGAVELQIAETGSPLIHPVEISVAEDALSALRFTPVTAVSLTALTFSIASREDADKVSIDA